MDAQPKHRWLRFRLSTVLILTAIAAWAMACRSWVDWGYERSKPIAPPNYTEIQIVTNINFRPDSPPEGDCVTVIFTRCVAHNADEYWLTIGPKRFFVPFLALVAFLAWKAAWAVIERRRARRATHLEPRPG